jgi:hypothetical protein
MFATLLGPLPRPPVPDDAAPEALLDAVLAAQVEAGLEPLTDGGWPAVRDDVVAAWRATAGRAGGLVKAVLPGPCTDGVPVERLRSHLAGLVDAGCRWIEVHEPAAVGIGDDPDARARFAEAHRALTADLGEAVHLSLVITGGNADGAGIETILAGAYASLAVDLIAGPDNWRLIRATPGDRGVLCGVLSPRPDSDDGPELMLWAAGYAASTGARGPARVGLASAGSLADLPWEVARRKLDRLGHAARLAELPPEERRSKVDPRSVDLRSAALGRYDPAAERPRRPPRS